MSQKILEDFTVAVRNERKATLQVLEMINLIEQKRLHLELGYSSLFDFLVRGHQYSEGAAMRRINSARLLCELPAIAPQVQSGELKLSQLSTAKQMQALQQLQSLESHLVPDGAPAKLIALLLERELARKNKPAAKKSNHHRRYGGGETVSKSSAPKSITPALRRNLLQQYKCCQYRSPQTGQQCNSTYQLQIEHIQPRWAGGTNEQTNLTVLCGAHNRHRYLMQAGQS